MNKQERVNPPQVDFAFYALPYSSNEPILTKWFDIQQDKLVLIGSNFWNLIGGEGVYYDVINEITSLGNEYKEKLYEGYL